KIGREASFDHLQKQGITLNEEKYQDSGLILYKSDQPVNAGGSGTACSAVVTFGHLIQKLKNGKLKWVLCVATKYLHPHMTVQQKNTNQVITHAFSIEAGSD